MVTYCACCGARISRPKRPPGGPVPSRQRFLCDSCESLKLAEVSAREQTPPGLPPSEPGDDLD